MIADVPDFVAAREHVLREVVRLVRLLRRDGVAVPANAALQTTEALARVGLDDRRRVRVALRTTLASDPRDLDAVDDRFEEFWYRLRTGLEATATVDDAGERADGTRGGETAVEGATTATGAEAEADPDTAEGESGLDAGEAEVRSRRVVEDQSATVDGSAGDERPGTYSAVADRRPVDDPGASGVDRAAVRRLARALAALPGRRWTRSRAGAAVDARRALRRSLATGGVPARLPERERVRSALRGCVLVDVSQSVLDAVDRPFLLAFLDALVAAGRSVRVFFFDTDVREVTDAFEGSAGDPAAALERAEVTWGGGTRIGESLRGIERRWPHAVDRRTATLVVSDGLDVGDVDDLERGMSWLSRRSGAVVWLNPIAATAGYEPTCRGMAAALPYVDGLFAFAGNDDVREVAGQLERRGAEGLVGYEHDGRERTGESLS